MNLSLDTSLAEGYKNCSQIARVTTEGWAARNLFCPRCGCQTLAHQKNNSPVNDFKCPSCGAGFELKSKQGAFSGKVADGAYETMIQRICSSANPDFFFLNYDWDQMAVTELFVIPNFFFVPAIIEKRTPLPDSARRAGWVGCSIVIGGIPNSGKIRIIKDGQEISKESVVSQFVAAKKLEVKKIDARGWLFDILKCVDSLPSQDFTLSQIYAFEPELKRLHPENNNIRAKIRQQLQELRDRDALKFEGSGRYSKIS